MPRNTSAHRCAGRACEAASFSALNKEAIEAGRDGASIFKSLLERKGFIYAAERARKIITTQCPKGYTSIACRAFEQNVQPNFKARNFIADNGSSNIEIHDESSLISQETTIQLQLTRNQTDYLQSANLQLQK